MTVGGARLSFVMGEVVDSWSSEIERMIVLGASVSSNNYVMEDRSSTTPNPHDTGPAFPMSGWSMSLLNRSSQE